MHIPPVGTPPQMVGSGDDPNHPVSEVMKYVSQCQTDVYNEMVAWLSTHKNADGNAVSKELEQVIVPKYQAELNQDLNNLRNQGYGPVIDGMKPSPYQDFSNYVQQIQSAINYNGPTKVIPKPPTPENQIAVDKQDVENAIAQIQKDLQNYQTQLSAAETAYQNALTAYNNAQTAVNNCKDPTKRSQASADLLLAQAALSAAKKALTAIKTDPHITALKQQLTAAQAILSEFPPKNVNEANELAAAAKQAAANGDTDWTALKKLLSGITQSISQATTQIQAALTAINPTPPNTPVKDYNKLVIDGVTCNEVNGLIFPSGGLKGWGTSEGMGNWIRDAWKNGDMKLFQALINSYYHVCKQAPDHMGLMPWSIDKNGNALDKGSATDADEDIISTLIDAVGKDPNLTMTDSDGSTMKVSDMLKQAVSNFAKLDCGSANGLTGGSTQWTLGAGFTDYLDPTALAKMINYAKANGMAAQATTIGNAMQSMMQYVKNELNGNGGLPSNSGDGSCALSRDLYRLTEFISSPLSAAYPSLKSEATSIVQGLLTKGFASGAIKLGQNPPSVSVTTPGSFTLGGAQASAPVYMAMMLLNKQGLLPPGLASQIPGVKAGFDHDMDTQFNNLKSESPSTYSNNGDYFGLTLGILSESLLQEYS